MKKLFGMVVLLFFIYFLYHVTFVYFQGGHDINYELNDGDNKVEINEILRSSNKNDPDNYSISLKINDTEFNIQTFYNFGRSSNIIKNVKYYKDNDYQCIFIKYRNDKILNDIMCVNNNIMISYHNISNISEGLKAFADSMETYGYDESNWKDDTSKGKTTEDSILYSNNLIENHFIGISAPSGMYRVNTIDQIRYVKLYTNTLNGNEPLLKGFVNDKYIVTNYDDNKLYRYYVVNMTNSGSALFGASEISANTYTLGSYGTSLYIYDPNTKKEYELDYAAQNLIEVGNEETNILYYNNGRWQITPINSDLVNLKFGNNYSNDYSNNEYEKIIKVCNEYGYYYLFKKVNGKYIAYRSDITKKESLMYLFTTSSLNNLVFNDDFIYYVSDGSLKYYSDETGNRTVLNNSTILSKANVAIGLYIKKEKN
jgi:hypothetical protein